MSALNPLVARLLEEVADGRPSPAFRRILRRAQEGAYEDHLECLVDELEAVGCEELAGEVARGEVHAEGPGRRLDVVELLCRTAHCLR